MIPKKSSPEPTKLTFGSAARACKTNRVRQESGPDGGGPASALRPKRRRDRHRNAGDDARPEGLGCPPSGVRVSQHVKGGWATSLLTDAFLPRILTSFSLCGCSRARPSGAGIRRDPLCRATSLLFSHNLTKLKPAGSPLKALASTENAFFSRLSPSSPAPLLSYQRRSRRHKHTRGRI